MVHVSFPPYIFLTFTLSLFNLQAADGDTQVADGNTQSVIPRSQPAYEESGIKEGKRQRAEKEKRKGEKA